MRHRSEKHRRLMAKCASDLHNIIHQMRVDIALLDLTQMRDRLLFAFTQRPESGKAGK